MPLVYLIAGEASGDRLGAGLIRALRTRREGRIRFAGMGAEDMAREGVVSPFPVDELANMGITEIPRHIPLILRRIREVSDAVIVGTPGCIGHHRLA